MSSVEQGLTITRPTQCRVGCHMFTWASDSSGKGSRQERLYCDCGLVVWEADEDQPRAVIEGRA